MCVPKPELGNEVENTLVLRDGEVASRVRPAQASVDRLNRLLRLAARCARIDGFQRKLPNARRMRSPRTTKPHGDLWPYDDMRRVATRRIAARKDAPASLPNRS